MQMASRRAVVRRCIVSRTALVSGATLFVLSLISPAFIPALTAKHRAHLLLTGVIAGLNGRHLRGTGVDGVCRARLLLHHSIFTTGYHLASLFGHFPLFPVAKMQPMQCHSFFTFPCSSFPSYHPSAYSWSGYSTTPGVCSSRCSCMSSLSASILILPP